MVPGNWRRQWWHRRKKTGPRTQWWKRRRWQRTRNRRRVRGIGDNDRGGEGSTTVLRSLQQWRRHRRRKMITKTTTTRTEALTDNRQRVQDIGDDNGGGSGSTTVLVNWQLQRSVDSPFYCIANSNTVSSLSCCCLDLIYFFIFLFFVHCNKYYQYCNHAENICVPSVH